MNPMQDDELILLWQQGMAAEPDPAEIARLAGRASMKRFDRIISRRNFREYAGGAALLILFAWNFFRGDDRTLQVMAFITIVVYVAIIWWYSRGRASLDPSSNARAYQAAMLLRIDRQIRLLSKVRWFGIPVALLNAWLIFNAPWRLLHDATATRLIFVIATLAGSVAVQAAIFIWIVWLNERSRWGIPWLREARSRMERLYGE